MKKVMSLLLAICVSFLAIVPSFAVAPSVDDQIAYLQNLGVPEYLFGYISNQQIYDLYMDSQSLILGDVEEASVPLYTDGEVSTYGTIPEADMSFSIIQAPFFKSDNITYDHITIFVVYNWAVGHPLTRGEDGVAVNWNEDLFYVESKSFSSSDKVFSGDTLVNSITTRRLSASSQGGLGYTVTFPPVHDAGTIFSFSGSAGFDLKPVGTMYRNGTRSTTVNAEYCHNKSFIGSVGFTYEGFGVTITPPVMSDSAAVKDRKSVV